VSVLSVTVRYCPLLSGDSSGFLPDPDPGVGIYRLVVQGTVRQHVEEGVRITETSMTATAAAHSPAQARRRRPDCGHNEARCARSWDMIVGVGRSEAA